MTAKVEDDLRQKEIEKQQKEIEQLRCELAEAKDRIKKAESLLKKIQSSFGDDDEEKTQTIHHAWGMIDCYFDLMEDTCSGS